MLIPHHLFTVHACNCDCVVTCMYVCRTIPEIVYIVIFHAVFRNFSRGGGEAWLRFQGVTSLDAKFLSASPRLAFPRGGGICSPPSPPPNASQLFASDGVNFFHAIATQTVLCDDPDLTGACNGNHYISDAGPK